MKKVSNEGSSCSILLELVKLLVSLKVIRSLFSQENFNV